MAYLRCDMDPIRTELPVHIFRLYATRKNDNTGQICKNDEPTSQEKPYSKPTNNKNGPSLKHDSWILCSLVLFVGLRLQVGTITKILLNYLGLSSRGNDRKKNY